MSPDVHAFIVAVQFISGAVVGSIIGRMISKRLRRRNVVRVASGGEVERAKTQETRGPLFCGLGRSSVWSQHRFASTSSLDIGVEDTMPEPLATGVSPRGFAHTETALTISRTPSESLLRFHTPRCFAVRFPTVVTHATVMAGSRTTDLPFPAGYLYCELAFVRCQGLS